MSLPLLDSTLSTEEVALLDWLKSSIPRWLWMDDKAQELWGATVKSLIRVQMLIEDLNLATYILTATDIWLEQHAADRGTSRQGNETDVALRSRLRNVPDALTRSALLDAANAILAADGVIGSAAMVELPRDAASLGAFTADTGVGGTFAPMSGTTYKFSPTVPFAMPPFVGATLTRLISGYKLIIAGAASAGNDGTFAVTGLDGDGALYTNAAGVAGVDGGVGWTTDKLDRQGNVQDVHGKAFCSRGFRAARASKSGMIIVILPFGSTAGTVASVTEMLRQKKAGGIASVIEVRLSP